MQDQLTRRRFAQLTTATAVTGLAGCSSEGDTGDSAAGGDGGDDTATPEPDDEDDEDDEDEATATPEPTATETEQPDVTILEHGLEEDTLGQKVVGKMENTSGEEQSYLGVEAKFFNADDERIGEGMDNATDVSAGTVVNFEIHSTADEEIDSYELEASTSAL